MEINKLLLNISVFINLVSITFFIMSKGFKKSIHRKNDEWVITLLKNKLSVGSLENKLMFNANIKGEHFL